MITSKINLINANYVKLQIINLELDDTKEINLDKKKIYLERDNYKSYPDLKFTSEGDLYLFEYSGYEIFASIYKFNHTMNLKVANNENAITYPLYCLSITYTKPLVYGIILEYYFSFEPDSKLNGKKMYLSGKCRYHVNCYDLLDNDTKNSDMELKELHTKLFKNITDEIKNLLLNNSEADYSDIISQRHIYEKFMSFCANDNAAQYIKNVIDMRTEEKQKTTKKTYDIKQINTNGWNAKENLDKLRAKIHL